MFLLLRSRLWLVIMASEMMVLCSEVNLKDERDTWGNSKPIGILIFQANSH